MGDVLLDRVNSFSRRAQTRFHACRILESCILMVSRVFVAGSPSLHVRADAFLCGTGNKRCLLRNILLSFKVITTESYK